MRIGLALMAVGAVGALLAWLKQDLQRSRVSPAWLVDAERRSWGMGIDQACWTWPNDEEKQAARVDSVPGVGRWDLPRKP